MILCIYCTVLFIIVNYIYITLEEMYTGAFSVFARFTLRERKRKERYIYTSFIIKLDRCVA